MIAAVSARKSTQQDVADDAKSVGRQVEHACAYCALKGWPVNEACIYIDDGIRRAEFEKRPDLVRLLRDVEQPRPPFQVLVMSEESRSAASRLKPRMC